MLPPVWFAPWYPGALYAELYIGLWRALTASWLRTSGLTSGARSAAAARPQTPAAPAAASGAAAAPAKPRPRSKGALIISFERARARRAARL